MGRIRRLFGRGGEEDADQRDKVEGDGAHSVTPGKKDGSGAPPTTKVSAMDERSQQPSEQGAPVDPVPPARAESRDIVPLPPQGGSSHVDDQHAQDMPSPNEPPGELQGSERDSGATEPASSDVAPEAAAEPEHGVDSTEPAGVAPAAVVSADEVASSADDHGADTPQVLAASTSAAPLAGNEAAAEPEAETARDEPVSMSPSEITPPTVGSVIGGRFTVVRPLSAEDAAELLGDAIPSSNATFYAVDDRIGYERCWSCGSTNNDNAKRFCVDCGAPQNRESVLARTDTATGDVGEFTEGGAFYHVLNPRKQFGSTGISLEVGSYSAEGPHHPNEDSYWSGMVGGCFDSRSETVGVAVLADGMGGYAPGSGLISREIVSTVGRSVLGSLANADQGVERGETEIRAMVHGAIAEANNKVLEQIRSHGEMGATLVVAVIYGPTAFLANIGDSRAYYISSAGTVAQITRDQSFVEQQVALGRLDPDAVFTALGNNVILHAVGEEAVEDAFDWYTQPLEPGSRLMLCSDGYWKTMQHAVWDPQAAAPQPTLRSLARTMVETALAENSDDNTTVLLVGID
ncbi:MAG: hypothetical protein JWO59_378, partial [Chloroflexi bacterium]|nr:hypothetical protein [Chloroflexota bacterium]